MTESIDQVAFGDVLKAFRKRKRLNQQHLAELVDVHRNTIGAWERGDNLPESKAIVLELARHLDLSEQETRLLLEASLTALSSHWFVPCPRNPFFTGREELLQQLHLELSMGKTNALTPAQFCALRGLGGIGKTQVAIEYSYRYYQDYTAVFWIRAETLETIFASFAAIANHLSLTASSDQNQIVEAVKHWLAAHRGWLLIIDNLEHIGLVKPFWPSTRQGAILVTTRLQGLASLTQVIEMQPMTLEEGTNFLFQRVAHRDSSASLKRVSVEDVATAKRIVTAMDGLPLALDQAGAYIEETQCDFGDFLRLFETSPLSLLQERDTFSEHPASVVGTFVLAFKKIQQINPGAADLLTVCSFLAPDAIPEEMLVQGASPLVNPSLSDPFLFRAALRDLLAYALIQRNPETQTLSIHCLVQTVLKESLPKREQDTWAKRALQLIDQSFPADFLTNEYQRRCERLLPHVQASLSVFKETGNMALLEASSLHAKMAWYFLSRGRYGEAEPLWLEARHVAEAVVGSDCPEMMPILNGLATLYTLQGKYLQAERLFRQALQIWEIRPTRDHLPLACSLHGLAVLSRDWGKYEEAESLFQQTLQIREQTQGVDHPWVAMTANDFAHLFFRQGKHLQAERLFQRAARIWEQPGSNATDTYLAGCLTALAMLYSMQGKKGEANSLVQHTLHIWEQERRSNNPYQAY